MPTPRTITDHQLTVAVAMKWEGRTYPEISETTGMSLSAIQYHFRKFGLGSRSHPRRCRPIEPRMTYLEQVSCIAFRWEGLTISEVAERVGVTSYAAAWFLPRVGLGGRDYKGWPQKKIDEAHRLRSEGKGFKTIARILKTCPNTVKKYLK